MTIMGSSMIVNGVISPRHRLANNSRMLVKLGSLKGNAFSSRGMPYAITLTRLANDAFSSKNFFTLIQVSCFGVLVLLPNLSVRWIYF